MSYTYAIDLGIHPDATGGKAGTDRDHPYPMQIALTQGTLVQENDRYTGFTPEALASFGQIKAGDIIIFRVFDTKSICRTGGRALEGVSFVEVTFNDLNGVEISELWSKSDVDPHFSKASIDQRSLAFTSVPGGMELPCFFQLDRSDGIVIYRITQPNQKDPVPSLFSVLVETNLTPDPSEKFYHRDDPELVISPDEDPPIGGPDQPLGIAAMSR